MKLLTSIAVIGALSFSASSSIAQEQIHFPSKAPCAPKEQLIAGLSKYGEKGLASGSVKLLSAKNGMEYEGDLHMYVNPKTYDYTLVIDFNDDSGIACILAVGSGFGTFVGTQTTIDGESQL